MATESAPNTAPFAITVEPDQTLQNISDQYLGGYDLQRLHQIQTLNPKLTDPDHIEVGQTIWLPGPSSSAAGNERDNTSQCEEASMSRNFELMTQLELEAGVTDQGQAACGQLMLLRWKSLPSFQAIPAMPAGKRCCGSSNAYSYRPTEVPRRQVVLCGVDDENGSSSVCAKAGRTLAANSSRPVCLVDANLRSPRLSTLFGVDAKTSFSSPSASSARAVCEDWRQSLARRT